MYTFCLLLLFVLAALVLVFKNKNTAAWAVVLTALIVYIVGSMNEMLHIWIFAKNGIGNWSMFLWYFINIVIMLIVAFFIWKKKRKCTICFLWIMLLVLVVQHWNTWFNWMIQWKALVL